MKILGPFLELPAKQPIQPIYFKIGPNWPNWPNWQCCLAGSSKTAPRILIFSIAMSADYSFEIIFIDHAQWFLEGLKFGKKNWKIFVQKPANL